MPDGDVESGSRPGNPQGYPCENDIVQVFKLEPAVLNTLNL
jgi:hypothetical protein